MIRSNLARIPWLRSVLIAAGIFTFANPGLAAATSTSDSYTWSAKLVEFDRVDRTVTIESLVATHGGLENADTLHMGDRAMLTWSGVFSASGVRSIVSGSRSEHDRFTMPVEFVSTEMDGRYVRFKVRVPAEDVAAIEALEPGQWVTATTPHDVAGLDQVVSSIRPYNDASAS